MVSSSLPYYNATGDATKNTSDSCTAQAHRILTQVFVTGARVFGRAFAEAYKQASASQVTHPLRLPSTTTSAKYPSSEIRPKPPKKSNSSQHPLCLRPHPRRSLPHPQRFAPEKRPSRPEQGPRAIQTVIRHERAAERRVLLPAEQGFEGAGEDRTRGTSGCRAGGARGGVEGGVEAEGV